MYVIRLATFTNLYGGHRHPKIEPYEVLLARSQLVEWKYVPPKSVVIYISHEWTSSNHCDPEGDQIYHLMNLLKRLRGGEIPSVDMDPFHIQIYNHTFSTTAEEWVEILSSQNTYIWYDGCCVPKSKREEAFRSIPAYVRRCDFTIILVPGCKHFDRVNPTTQRRINLCFRTYRRRARCVFEMMSAFLTSSTSEDERPMLQVNSGTFYLSFDSLPTRLQLTHSRIYMSGTGTPVWVSPLECQKLAVGTSVFECCESNHIKIEACRRPSTARCLKNMIDCRVGSLFYDGNIVIGRFTNVFAHWWLRGLGSKLNKNMSILDFKRQVLHWDLLEDEEYFDRSGVSVLMYSVLADQIKVVETILHQLDQISDKSERTRRLEKGLDKNGLLSMGFPGNATPLHAALGLARPEIVLMLLDKGISPNARDVIGDSPFLVACLLGRLDNLKVWFVRITSLSLSLPPI